MKYLCIKDWEWNGKVYFQKGKRYRGREIKLAPGTTVELIKMIGEYNMRFRFQKDNEFFG